MRIGFVSTRFAGTDGVSLESCKWAEVLETNGHACFWFAGELNRNGGRSYLVPEAHFLHEKNAHINAQILGQRERSPMVTRAIHALRSSLKVKLHEFIRHNELDLLIVENALTIPMNVPLGLALTEAIAETQLPAIAHHHDFYWERVRFSVNAVGDYIRMAFPPNLANMEHVVINTEAQEQLALRTGIASHIIPNVIDFENPPEVDRERSNRFKKSIGLEPGDRMILQPTRIVQRKGIEHAIALVKALGDPTYKLVVSHEAGDEGFEYAEWLKEYACEHEVDLRIVSRQIDDPWMCCPHSRSECSLWDVYPHADFITYPSLYEGFGNAFLEAIYFRKPLLINRYATFVRDIEPLGFELAVMDGYLSRQTIQEVREILENPDRRKQMVDHNYEVASRHYSYKRLRKGLNSVFQQLFGDTLTPLGPMPAVTPDARVVAMQPPKVVFHHNGRQCASSS